MPGDAAFEQAVNIHENPSLLMDEIRDSLAGKTEDSALTEITRKLAKRTIVPCEPPDPLPFEVSMAHRTAYSIGLDLWLCGDCRKKHGIGLSKAYEQQLDELAKRKPPDMETMALFGAAIKPIMDAAVERRKSHDPCSRH